MLNINGNRLLKNLEELNRYGLTAQNGISRVSLTSPDIAARKYLLNLMKEAGLQTNVDPVANVIGVLPNGTSLDPVMTGSHSDTVINGGRFDGSYGVIAAIEALRTIKENNIKLSRPLAAVSFTNEEGIRFPPMTGSKFMARLIELEEAYSLRDPKGVTFRQALEASHLELGQNSVILGGKSCINVFIELHIEQGPLLERDGVHIGIVENIVGTLRYDVSIEGSADHAGTTPMNMRKDALVAASRLILGVGNLTKEIGGAVGTVGFIEVAPNAPNVVPGKVRLTIDLRHVSEEALTLLDTKLGDMTDFISKETGTSFGVEVRSRLAPARMSERIMKVIEETSQKLTLSFIRMQSGAGHDSMIMSHNTDTGVIFVPSKGGKSHTPLEETAPEHLVNGANVLVNALATLAQ